MPDRPGRWSVGHGAGKICVCGSRPHQGRRRKPWPHNALQKSANQRHGQLLHFDPKNRKTIDGRLAPSPGGYRHVPQLPRINATISTNKQINTSSAKAPTPHKGLFDRTNLERAMRTRYSSITQGARCDTGTWKSHSNSCTTTMLCAVADSPVPEINTSRSPRSIKPASRPQSVTWRSTAALSPGGTPETGIRPQ